MRKFLISLSGISLEHNQFRDWKALAQSPSWVDRSRHLDKIKSLLDRIPPLERDILELYFFAKKREAQIARMLGLSQQAVSHRMYAAFRRIVFMAAHPDVAPEKMRQDLVVIIVNPRTVDVLCDWAVTSSQTATAQRLSLPLQRIGEHVKGGMKILRVQTSESGVFYAEYFGRLLKHRNIYREVLAGPRRKVDDAVIEAEKYAHLSTGQGAQGALAGIASARSGASRSLAGAA